MNRILSMILCIMMVLLVPMSAMAATDDTPLGNDHNTISYGELLNDYSHYTIDLTNRVTKDTMMSNNAFSQAESVENAIAYVKSLKLASAGYDYIEEACIIELKNYQKYGIELDSYTVLVPKSKSADKVFGTYNGRTFYWDTTSLSEVRYDVNGNRPSIDTLNHWIQGLFSVAMCFTSLAYSIPYTMVTTACNAPSNVTVSYGSYFRYSFNTSPVSRTIYTYASSSSTNRKVVYVDQRGTVNSSIMFCPVGMNWPSNNITIKEEFGRDVKTERYDDTSYILLRSSIMYNHNSVEYWFLSTQLISETWG